MNTNTIQILGVECVEDGDCLMWGGRLGGHASGHPYCGQRGVRRAVWEQERGAIPVGLVVQCTCRISRCVAVGHMRLATIADAMRAGRGATVERKRAHSIAKTVRASGRARLTLFEVRAIRASDEPGTVWAARLGVSKSTISSIRRGASHREFVGDVWAGLL